MQLTDTHCHIHSTDYPVPIADVDTRCAEAGVTRLICVGTDADDSERAIRFVRDRPGSWAAIGLHPHEAKFGQEPLEKLRRLLKAARVGTTAPRPSTFSLGEATSARAQDVIESEKGGGAPQEQPNKQAPRLIPPLLQKDDKAPRGDEVTRDTLSLHPGSIASFREKGGSGALSSGGAPTEGATNKIVAIGECGLDYFYDHSSKADQERALRYQIELALEYDLPLIFHIRDAFDDFWPIFDSYLGLRGELHSFTDNLTNLNKAISRGLYIGVNGIITFAKNTQQIEVAKQIPINKLLLETDSPFLTPAPLRGTVNEPARVRLVAAFLASLRQSSLDNIAAQTTTNARQLFSI